MPDNYIGTFVPRGVPAEVIAKLHDAILNATKDPEVRAQFAKMGMPVWYNNEKTWISWWMTLSSSSTRRSKNWEC